MAPKSIVIVGGGLAGLSAGCYGQMNGYATTVFEAGALPGGCCAHWKRGAYTFDGCLQYLAGTRPGGLFSTLWRELGALRGLEIHNFDTFNVVISEDRQRSLRLFTDPDRLEEELLRVSPEDKALIRRVLASVRLLLRGTPMLDKPDELMGPLEKLSAASGAWPFLWTMLRWRHTTLADLSAGFRDPLLRHAFGVLEFPQLPAFQFLLALALVGAKNAGLPAGGAPALVGNIVKRYRDLGGTLRCRTPVERILVQGGRAAGVRLGDGSEVEAGAVISACDGRRTLFQLLEGRYLDRATAARYRSWQAYPSGLRVSLGVNRDLRDQPATLTVVLDRPLRFGQENRTSLVARHFSYDPSFAPERRSAVVVFTAARIEPWRELVARGQEVYQSEKRRVADQVVAALERIYPGFGGQVEVVDVATPLTFERYTQNTDGSIEGWQPVVGGPGIMTAVPQRLPALAGFYQAGHWSFVAAAARDQRQTPAAPPSSSCATTTDVPSARKSPPKQGEHESRLALRFPWAVPGARAHTWRAKWRLRSWGQAGRCGTLEVMRAWVASAVFVLGMLLGPLAALADLAPPETIGCAGKKAGDACADATTGAAGVCQDKTCVSPKPDGTSSSYACLQCLPGPKDDSGCAIGSSASLRRVGPWALAGLVSLLCLFGRRRKGVDPHR